MSSIDFADFGHIMMNIVVMVHKKVILCNQTSHYSKLGIKGVIFNAFAWINPP
jgi:hypothetical protein